MLTEGVERDQKGIIKSLSLEEQTNAVRHYKHYEVYYKICNKLADENPDKADMFRRSGFCFFSMYAGALHFYENNSQDEEAFCYNRSLRGWVEQIDSEVLEYFKLGEKILGDIPWDSLETESEEA